MVLGAMIVTTLPDTVARYPKTWQLPVAAIVHALIWAAMFVATVEELDDDAVVAAMICKLLTVTPLTVVPDEPETVMVVMLGDGARAYVKPLPKVARQFVNALLSHQRTYAG